MTEIKKQALRLQGMRHAANLAEISLRSSLATELLKHGSAIALADQLGVSPSYLSDVRHGKRGIGDEMLQKLCGIE